MFTHLQENRLGGLMSLDLMMIPLMPITILHLVAVYAALRRVNESYALIALVFGLTGNVLIMTTRPLAEMVYLSDQYAAATGDIARGQYVAAGEAFHALFGGTAWLWWNVLTGLSYTISSLLMLRSPDFSRATAYVGIVIFIVGIGFWIPGIGLVLSLLGTFGAVFWFLLQAPAFFRLGWDRQYIRALASV
jgi:hypothetical protein